MKGTLPEPVVSLRAYAAQARLDIADRHHREMAVRYDQERRMAAEQAASYVRRAFPVTLNRVLTAYSWAGHRGLAPAETDGFTAIRPCATAYLGDGYWLHHATAGLASKDVLTLYVPCSCGNYDIHRLDTELDLADALAGAARTAGTCPGDCFRPVRLPRTGGTR